MTNSDFLKTFEDLRPLLALTGGQILINNVAPNEYVIHTYEGSYYFGVKKNRLYVTNIPSFAEDAGRTYGASLGVKPWSAEVKENRLYASVNMTGIANLYRSYGFTGNNAVKLKEVVHNEDRRNRNQPLSAYAEDERFFAFSHCLQAINLLKIDNDKRRCKASNANELRAERDRCFVLNKQPHDLRRKQLECCNAHTCNNHSVSLRRLGKAFHPRIVF